MYRQLLSVMETKNVFHSMLLKTLKHPTRTATRIRNQKHSEESCGVGWRGCLDWKSTVQREGGAEKRAPREADPSLHHTVETGRGSKSYHTQGGNDGEGVGSLGLKRENPPKSHSADRLQQSSRLFGFIFAFFFLWYLLFLCPSLAAVSVERLVSGEGSLSLEESIPLSLWGGSVTIRMSLCTPGFPRSAFAKDKRAWGWTSGAQRRGLEGGGRRVMC